MPSLELARPEELSAQVNATRRRRTPRIEHPVRTAVLISAKAVLDMKRDDDLFEIGVHGSVDTEDAPEHKRRGDEEGDAAGRCIARRIVHFTDPDHEKGADA